MSKKEIQSITRNSELYGALVELDYTKTLLEDQLKDLLIEVKSVKSAIRKTTKRFQIGSELYRKNHGKFILLKKR